MRLRKRIACALALACLGAALGAAPAQADFGIESLAVTASNRDGTIDTQAGSRPYEYTVDFELNQDSEGDPEGIVRDLFLELPPGLVGNPRALPRCGRAAFDLSLTPKCPGDTQVGVADIVINNGSEEEDLYFHTGVYNLTPTPGSPATIGLAIKASSLQEASLRSDGDYGVTLSDVTIPTGIELKSVIVHTWGMPMDESHFGQRLCPNPINPLFEVIEGCPSDAPPAPFLTLPPSCTGPLATRVRVDSLQDPGVFAERTVLSRDEAEVPVGLDGCNALGFEPSISSRPTTSLADSPSGLDFDLHQRQDEECSEAEFEGEPTLECGLATSPVRDVTVTLPAGMALNPAAATGLEACTEGQIGRLGGGGLRFSTSPQSCPDAAKVGTVQALSPLLDHPVAGSVYVARPYQNPFGTLLGIYLALEDLQTGIVVKLAGKVTTDPSTGQLTTSFKQNPQLPIEDVSLHLFEGARAALRTPLACGTHTTTSTMTPWSAPEGIDKSPSDSFQTTASPAPGPCPGSEAQAPNAPSASAGTIAPVAGAYSPFVFKLTRPDGTAPISAVDIALPEGLTGRLAGLATCPEAQIAQAKSREAPEMGAVEQADPSCPASSEVGTVTAGAGAGPAPFHASGHAYLAGPYEGAPISFVFVVPAVAGPFDLGAVVTRAAAYVDPATAKITVRSDPLPTVLEGIPLDLRSIAVSVDRPDFTLNPTSCEAMALGVGVSSPFGSLASLANRFQVGGCSSLPYKPRLTTRIYGKTGRGAFPKLVAKIHNKPGEANSSRLAVTLPHSEFLEQGHFGTICTRVQFAAKACPDKSIYGWVKVRTPLLAYPLEGPVYLRSSEHNLPDLVLDLKGPAWQPIEITLVSRIDSKHKGIRSSFEGLPDAPFEEAVLTMRGGKQGLLVNSTDVCAKTNRSLAKLSAQSGAQLQLRPKLLNPKCAKAKKKNKRQAKRRRGHRGRSR
jgi:hypothetical protein